MLPYKDMEKAQLATLLLKLAPLSMCGFILALMEGRKKEPPGYLGDNFPKFNSSFKAAFKRNK
ncbi:MAG: hypothetical protein JW734_02270 [Candidatus Omnitrophica bacterium]|nr:hypothetical protein [Candidatus Omnitrophota bacterium]